MNKHEKKIVRLILLTPQMRRLLLPFFQYLINNCYVKLMAPALAQRRPSRCRRNYSCNQIEWLRLWLAHVNTSVAWIIISRQPQCKYGSNANCELYIYFRNTRACRRQIFNFVFKRIWKHLAMWWKEIKLAESWISHAQPPRNIVLISFPSLWLPTNIYW